VKQQKITSTINLFTAFDIGIIWYDLCFKRHQISIIEHQSYPVTLSN